MAWREEAGEEKKEVGGEDGGRKWRRRLRGGAEEYGR